MNGPTDFFSSRLQLHYEKGTETDEKLVSNLNSTNAFMNNLTTPDAIYFDYKYFICVFIIYIFFN